MDNQPEINISIDPEQAEAIRQNCIEMFKNFLEQGDEDLAMENIYTATVLIFQSFEPDTPPACTSGCSYCCHQPVSLSLVEGRVLTQALRNLPPDQRKDSLRRIRQFAEQDIATRLEFRYGNHNRCPFLHDDGSCRAYDARPLNCRRYLSLSAEKCRERYEGKEVGLHGIPAYAVIFSILTEAVCAALNDYADIPIGEQYEMCSLISHLYDNGNASQKTQEMPLP